MLTYGPRDLVSPTPDYPIFVDRRNALFASWYEFFPRSQGAEYDEETETWTSGTFDSSYERLEAAAADGLRRHLPAARSTPSAPPSARARTTR